MARITVCTIIAALSFGAATTSPEQGKLMQETLASFRVLLPLSLSADEFRAAKNKSLIETHLQHLATSTSNVFSHFTKQHDERSFVANSLAHDAKEALDLYKKKNYDSSRFVLHHLSENCVNCHSKLPAKSQKHNVTSLFAELKDAKVSGLDLAHYLVMTRKFEEAAKAYEQAFISSPELLETKSFGKYLKVKIRVQRDLKGLQHFLGQLPRKKMDQKLANKLKAWQSSTAYLIKTNSLAKISLSTAETLITKGQALQDFPQDNRGVIYFVASSAIVQDLISSDKTPRDQQTEAYYLAGSIETHLAHSLWINETEHYFELAITTDPRSKWARLALKKLEEEYILGYSGSSGTHLPDDVKENLERLKKLVR